LLLSIPWLGVSYMVSPPHQRCFHRYQICMTCRTSQPVRHPIRQLPLCIPIPVQAKGFPLLDARLTPQHVQRHSRRHYRSYPESCLSTHQPYTEGR
jgi:hypothetical protein